MFNGRRAGTQSFHGLVTDIPVSEIPDPAADPADKVPVMNHVSVVAVRSVLAGKPADLPELGQKAEVPVDCAGFRCLSVSLTVLRIGEEPFDILSLLNQIQALFLSPFSQFAGIILLVFIDCHEL